MTAAVGFRESPAPEAARREPKLRRGRSETFWAVVLLLPVLLLFLVMYVVPTLAALALSFTDFAIVGTPEWVGLQNYVDLMHSPSFHQAFLNSVVYTVGTVVPSLFISLAVALALNQKVRGLAIFRAAYYAPQVASWVAISIIWLFMLNPSFGILNFLLTSVGLPRLEWLNSSSTALPTVILVGIWKFIGYGAVIFLAGLQGIPAHLYEAAHIDGMNAWQRFVNVTWPLLRPTTVFILTIMTIFSLQAFDQIYVLTGGGPGDTTATVVFDIYRNGFLFFKMGYASAMAMVWFLVIVVTSSLTLWRLGAFKER
jgi:multiple sugar transport system permease protein